MKKIPTIFKRDEQRRNLVTREKNPVCEWVFAGGGVATRKYDGTCCLIKDGILYKRRELKRGQAAPIDFVQADYDEITGKTVGWVPVDLTSQEDRWHAKAYANRGPLSDGTYELLGPKIQGNPEYYTTHVLLKHENAQQLLHVPRDFDGLREWFSDRNIEGIVFHHPMGYMAKIKKRDFGFKRT